MKSSVLLLTEKPLQIGLGRGIQIVMQKLIEESAAGLKKLFQSVPEIYIQPHDHPDPDAVGAAFGLQQLATCFGCQAEIVFEGTIHRVILQEMIGKLDIKLAPLPAEPKKKPVIVVDTKPANGNITLLKTELAGVIDHHEGPFPVPALPIQLIVPETGSSCTLISQIYNALHTVPSREPATAMAAGISGDTMHLLRGVTVEDVDQYSKLFAHADQHYLTSLLLNNLELPDLEYVQLSLKNLQRNGYFGVTDLGSTRQAARSAIVADFILSLREIKVVLVLSSRDNGVNLSVRSEVKELPADSLVGRITEGKGTSGGHATMAGGFIPVENAEERRSVRKKLQKRFLELAEQVPQQ